MQPLHNIKVHNSFKKNIRLHYVYFHRHFYQNRLINDCVRKNLATGASFGIT